MNIDRVCRIPHFVVPQSFWCEVCDCVTVNSDDPTTGKFFAIHGHVINPKAGIVEPDWPEVCFAVCSGCLDS